MTQIDAHILHPKIDLRFLRHLQGSEFLDLVTRILPVESGSLLQASRAESPKPRSDNGRHLQGL